MKDDIAKKIKTIRDSCNLSQERFAKKLGLSGKTISAYETGRTTPPLKVLDKILDTYNLPYVEISNESRKNLNNQLETLETEIIKLKEIIKKTLL